MSDLHQTYNFMIRKFKETDLTDIMQLWLKANIEVHNFIPTEYWTDNYDTVKAVLPLAEVYVYENDNTKQINGFIGLNENYIEGIFVEKSMRSKGIGKQLLDFAKRIKSTLILKVYQKNIGAVSFYRREDFVIQSENIDDNTNEKEFLMTWCK